MKTLTYERDTILEAVRLLDRVAFLDSASQGYAGIEKARVIARIADILDSGRVGELIEKQEEQEVKEDEADAEHLD